MWQVQGVQKGKETASIPFGILVSQSSMQQRSPSREGYVLVFTRTHTGCSRKSQAHGGYMAGVQKRTVEDNQCVMLRTCSQLEYNYRPPSRFSLALPDRFLELSGVITVTWPAF